VQAPLLVPNVLLLAIPLNGGRVLLTIPPPVIRIPGSPFLRAVPAYLAVLRVCGNLLAVIPGAAAALATGVAAHRLPRLIFRWLEDPLTVAASPFDHTGGCRILRSATVRLGDLETAIACVLHLGRWLTSLNYKTGGNAVVLSRHRQR
jgi:hypothetical protein